MINELLEYVKKKPFEPGIYATLAIYRSYVTCISAKNVCFILKNKNTEDKLTEENIFSKKGI